VREFSAGHGCSPGSSGRQWQGGGGNTFEGSPSSPMFSGSLGSVLLRPGLRAHIKSHHDCIHFGNVLSGFFFRSPLVEGFAVD
jgi:hypothetical protein